MWQLLATLALIAAASFRLAAQQAPPPSDASAALVKEADQFVLEGRVNQARASYEAAIKAGARIDQDAGRARSLALCYLNGTPSDFKKSAQWFEVAFKLTPKDDLRLALAQTLSWSGSFDAAAVHWKALRTAHPENVEYVLGLANTLAWGKRSTEAYQVLRQYLDVHPADQKMRVEYARVLASGKDYTEALDQYQMVLANEPGNTQAAVGVAKVFSWQDDFGKSIEAFDAILKKAPETFDALVGKGYALYWAGREDDARKVFQQAAKLNPRDPELVAGLKAVGSGARARAAAEPPPPPPPPPALASKVFPEVGYTRFGFDPPVLPEPFTTEDYVKDFADEAEAAAARGDLAAAIGHWREALALDPNHRGARRQVARILSWTKQYEPSLAEYERVIRDEPTSLSARLERARVWSWAQKYESSIADYRAVLSAAESDRNAAVRESIPVDGVKLELARVLSWSNQFNESVNVMNSLVPRDDRLTPGDVPLLVERARLLSYARRYDESLKGYQRALELSPLDRAARLGQGQVLYWSGQLQPARRVLRGLYTEMPENQELAIVLAAVEHGVGRTGSALKVLSTAGDAAEAQSLRKTIDEQLRPTVRFRVGNENNREDPSNGLASTLRSDRFSTVVGANLVPDVRFEVKSNLTQTQSSNTLLRSFGDDATATETTGAVSFRAAPWMRMKIEAGSASTGKAGTCATGFAFTCASPQVASTRHQLVYEIEPTFTSGRMWLGVNMLRHAADYTPLAVHSNVLMSRQTVTAVYSMAEWLRLASELSATQYQISAPGLVDSDTTSGGAALGLTFVVLQSKTLTVETGVRGEVIQFAPSTVNLLTPTTPGVASSPGFFAPKLYRRVAGLGRVGWTHNRMQFDLHGSVGPQRVVGFEKRPFLIAPEARQVLSATIGGQIQLVTGRFQPFVAYDFFSTATAAPFGTIQDGSYRSHAASLGLVLRF